MTLADCLSTDEYFLSNFHFFHDPVGLFVSLFAFFVFVCFCFLKRISQINVGKEWSFKMRRALNDR